MSAATQLHSRMAEYFVEYRYPASYLDCLREELSQFIYHFITFITLNKTKNTCFELRSLLVGEVFKDWNSACAPLLIYFIQFRLHQNWCKTNHFEVQIASNWYHKKSIYHHSDVQIASDWYQKNLKKVNSDVFHSPLFLTQKSTFLA